MRGHSLPCSTVPFQPTGSERSSRGQTSTAHRQNPPKVAPQECVLRGMKHLVRLWAACAACGCAPETPVPDTHRIALCYSDGSPADSGWVRVLGASRSTGAWGSGTTYEALSDTLRIGNAGSCAWPRSGTPAATEAAVFHPDLGWLPPVRMALVAPDNAEWRVAAATPTWYRFQLSRLPGLWGPPARYFVFPEWSASPDPGQAWSTGFPAHGDAWFEPQDPDRAVLVWPDVLPPEPDGTQRFWSIHAQLPDGMIRYCGALATAPGPALDTLVVSVTP